MNNTYLYLYEFVRIILVKVQSKAQVRQVMIQIRRGAKSFQQQLQILLKVIFELLHRRQVTLIAVHFADLFESSLSLGFFSFSPRVVIGS